MSGYQRQNGDIVELTAAGLEAVRSHKNNYADSTRPLAMDERRWSAWDMGNLWIGMLVSIAVYQVASGLIVSGMSWGEALFTIVLGHFLVMVFAVVLGHFGTKYGLTYPHALQDGVWFQGHSGALSGQGNPGLLLVWRTGMDWRSGSERHSGSVPSLLEWTGI